MRRMERKTRETDRQTDRQTQGGCSFVSPIRNEGALKRKERGKKEEEKKHHEKEGMGQE